MLLADGPGPLRLALIDWQAKTTWIPLRRDHPVKHSREDVAVIWRTCIA